MLGTEILDIFLMLQNIYLNNVLSFLFILIIAYTKKKIFLVISNE